MKKTVTCYLMFHAPSNEFRAFDFKPCHEGNGYIFITLKEVEFEVSDDFDPRPEQIKLLKEKQREAAADFHAMNTEIMRQISRLEAIEFSPGGAA